jgi:hypothetical protein
MKKLSLITSCNFIEKYVAAPIDLQLDMVIF